ncbi:hypothetical protein ND861_09235 [Leptospira sp. 2 VSF19]|uniref:Lipoprotein n=1 Tax=Leptospira soteropolitanensis TaxID=2950025 RepID=A0AAW5VIX8_9LEPT|nr:hypothetical protein [Leptospira soteropolitanensis]MCW7492613.1 hypothetical protein [Leptospira soteropolitanensis]MCW7500296.1 hypothetical protein [Leptospira soteropolitanensis]MCW7522669.1 hypothetical protein [Leptospira soteropolitanensis]MCW7526525.1 hypothetical protein [Leptospira soteropolitanensis]MCW7530266.1 hypothetical protein [Leptospira soteropolitanensis]
MNPIQNKQKKIVSASVLTSFAFVLVCTAGFFQCPKLGILPGNSESTASQDFAMPCHAESKGAEDPENSTNGNSCQCNEVSKSEDSSFQIEFSKLVRISIQKLYLPLHLELPIAKLLFETNRNNNDISQSNSQVLQKTVKLLI